MFSKFGGERLEADKFDGLDMGTANLEQTEERHYQGKPEIVLTALMCR